MALAIFPPEKYTGTITTDLFAEDETSYFDDAEQFFALQKEAVEELRKHHEASAAWVTVTEEYRLSDWQYRKARKNQKSGVLINLSPSGAVEIREGLVRPKIEKKTAEAIAENPIAPVKVKAAYSAPLCRTALSRCNEARRATDIFVVIDLVVLTARLPMRSHLIPLTSGAGRRKKCSPPLLMKWSICGSTISGRRAGAATTTRNGPRR